MAFTDTITRKYGPLPGWAWAGLAGGAFYLWERHKANAAASTDPTATDATGTDAGAMDTAYGAYSPNTLPPNPPPQGNTGRCVGRYSNDPAGHWHWVCDSDRPGHWQQSGSGWVWQKGPAR